MQLTEMKLLPIGGAPAKMSSPARPPVAYWLTVDGVPVDTYDSHRDCRKLSNIGRLVMAREMAKMGLYATNVTWSSGSPYIPNRKGTN